MLIVLEQSSIILVLYGFQFYTENVVNSNYTKKRDQGRKIKVSWGVGEEFGFAVLQIW